LKDNYKDTGRHAAASNTILTPTTQKPWWIGCERWQKFKRAMKNFYRLFRRALEDMAALRLPIQGTDHRVFLPAAGFRGSLRHSDATV